jgi:hypothetical protein
MPTALESQDPVWSVKTVGFEFGTSDEHHCGESSRIFAGVEDEDQESTPSYGCVVMGLRDLASID